jgi:antitoxin VapB
MNIARIFTVRNCQAVRLPIRLRFTSKEVEIFRNGDETILREKLNGGRRWPRTRGSLPRRRTDTVSA